MLLALCITSKAQKNPSFEEIISLQGISNPTISPNGEHIVFQKSSTDWKENRFDTEIWVSKQGKTPIQLTNNPEGSSNNPKWSPDGDWLAFQSKRGEKTQIHVLHIDGGEALAVTSSETGIGNFQWSPDGSQIAYTTSEDKSTSEDERSDKYGDFAIEDAEYSKNELWLMDFNPETLSKKWTPQEMEDSSLQESLKPKKLMDSVNFTVQYFLWSPDGSKIAFAHQPDPLINSFFHSDISIYDVESEEYASLINNPSADGLITWSPDGKSILYSTDLDDSLSNYYKTSKLFRIDIDGNNNKQLASDYDEWFMNVIWKETGIFGVSYHKTMRSIMRLDPDNGSMESIHSTPDRIWDISLSTDGKQIAFTGSGANDLTELYKSSIPMTSAQKITTNSDQINGWDVAQSEVIEWKSEDGTLIEGVLHKPQNFDPAKKYPLMVIIHGGPTGISTPSPTPAYVYPMVQWLNKGAIILRPNYRGSAGYGEAFRELNVRNLGVGDAWDVTSGVQYLIDEGIADAEKVAAMGWSQGGYISAFLTTQSDMFRAICVGAGISNWMTYYVNTDIHPFTRQYLKGTPWSDPDIYAKTSPMTNINNAETPTLIQHGEFDKRVPVANAYELFQGLQDVGVETKLIIYKGFGHGITKPKERLAAMWHNWQWFGKYIWDEDIEIPMD